METETDHDQAPARRGWFRRHWKATSIATIALLIGAAIAGGGGGGKASASNPQTVTKTVEQGGPTLSTGDTQPGTSSSGAAEPTVSQQQAIESAQSYLDTGGGFSRYGLLHQLTAKFGEGFPKADAVYAVKYVHPDWNAQAMDSGKSYLETGGGFSRVGLIQQLSSKSGEGFTHAQAVYAVKRLHPDWNAQAVQSAKSYLETGGFSRTGLIEQLSSKYGEGFTHAEAVYAVSQVGL